MKRFQRVAGRSNLLCYPLRKIVKAEGSIETLECGHTQRQRKDLTGTPTSAVRRRCSECHVEQTEAIPVRDVMAGRCFVRVVGTYAFLKLSRDALTKLGKATEEVWAVDYKGNVKSFDPDEPVTVAPHSFLIRNADWLYYNQLAKNRAKEGSCPRKPR